MPQTFDLVVIGTGTAATSVASPVRSAGWSVAIADSRPFGGTCAIRGCDPKKVLVGAADVLDAVRRMKGRGVAGDSVKIDWPELMRFKRTFTDPVPASRQKTFDESGIKAFHGTARFTSRTTLDIDGQTIEGRHFAICAGDTPAPLHIPGEEMLITSDDFLELEQMPKSIIFVGGGYIAFEFAHLAARAGASAAIVHRGARPLEHFDPALVDMLCEHTRASGIEVHLGAAVEAIEGTRGNLRVRIKGGEPLEAECVVHAAGRIPNLEALNLSAADVETSKAGVVVNEFLASVSNPAFYSAGDSAASGGPPLTPVAGYEGRIVAENLLKGNHTKPDYSGCASTVFTIPPLSAVGLTEESAKEKKLDFEVHTGDSSGWYSSRRIGEEKSGYKVLVERGSDRILGAHLFGDRAEEHINVFALAIHAGVPASRVKETLFAYPTHGSNTQYML